MEKIIAREALLNRIRELSKDFEVIGPKEIPNKGIFYQLITNAEDLYLGEGFSIEPVKKFFLKPSEWLFAERFKEGKDILEEEPSPAKKKIIFGVRPCEASGLCLLDKVFNAEYVDSFYSDSRLQTVIIGLGCQKPDKDCFCTSMGGSPVENRGMDAFIYECGNRFILEIITDKGKDIFGALGKEIDKTERESWESNKQKIKNVLEKKIKVPESLDNIFESDYWGEVSFPCLSCGICTYLCPTCHCFDLVDEERKRMRCYDGCAFPDFTLQASGENPRPTKRERYRQRVFHKFSYFKKNFGENLCVGCGRCIRHCPVKIDIADVVDKAPVSENR